MTDAVYLSPDDNICVAARNLEAGTLLTIAGGEFRLAQPVKIGHKIAVRPIAQGRLRPQVRPDHRPGDRERRTGRLGPFAQSDQRRVRPRLRAGHRHSAAARADRRPHVPGLSPSQTARPARATTSPSSRPSTARPPSASTSPQRFDKRAPEAVSQRRRRRRHHARRRLRHAVRGHAARDPQPHARPASPGIPTSAATCSSAWAASRRRWAT